jgi:hypothetical protein
VSSYISLMSLQFRPPVDEAAHDLGPDRILLEEQAEQAPRAERPRSWRRMLLLRPARAR